MIYLMVFETCCTDFNIDALSSVFQKTMDDQNQDTLQRFILTYVSNENQQHILTD
jgi:hypothetical protein